MPGRRSDDQAETATPLRWRAYVWPAVALRVKRALMPLLISLDGLADVRMPGVSGLLLPLAVSGSVGIAEPLVRPDPPARDLRSSPGFSLPDGGMGLLAIVLIGLLTAVGLVALARLVVGEDLFESRYWRGHRG